MLHVAQRTEERQLQQMQVTLVSLGTALLVGLVTSVWLRRRVRRELDPLLLMIDAVRRHDPLQGDEMPPATRDELVPMREAVMALGQRLLHAVAIRSACSSGSLQVESPQSRSRRDTRPTFTNVRIGGSLRHRFR
jgi:hypothetical protein